MKRSGLMKRSRLFDSRLSRRQRRIYAAVVAFYALATLGTIWPLYSLFAAARPLILGIPLSLFYVACWVGASFVVLLALFHWEARQQGGDEDEDGREG